MTKTPAGAILASFDLDRSAELPLFRQLFLEIRQAILDGALNAGTRLPSSRTLAADLEVSRNTVVQAFDLLIDEGFVESRVGDGAYVSAAVGARAVTSPLAPDVTLEATRGRPMSTSTSHATGPLSLGVPALDRFPIELWRRLTTRRLGGRATELLGYGEPAGLARLREAIARHLTTARGARCSPDQVLLFASAHEAMYVATRILTDPGDAVWLEEPGYSGARDAICSAGAVPVPVPVDGEGLRVTVGCRRRPDARVAFVTPSHQFPLGVTMSLRRRLELIDWAAASGAWIVEDDYDSEFRYEGRPIGALQGLLPERVLYLGTFSKALFPAVRLAYAVVPDDLRSALLAARRVANPYLPELTQAIVADFLEGGHFATHLRKMTEVYAGRRAAVDSALESLDSPLRLLPSASGLHVAARLESGDDGALARRARDEGVRIAPLSPHYQDAPVQGVLIGYGSAPPEEVATAVRQVASLSRE